MPDETRWMALLTEGRAARLAFVMLCVWIGAADSLVTATIMPNVTRDLGGYQFFSWAVAGFLVGAILAGVTSGRIAETIGLKRATALAGGILFAGCALSAVAPTVEVFLLGRFVQGVGSGWISGFAMIAVALLFPEGQIARVFAIASGVWGLATVFGPLIGGLIVQWQSWRVVFWLFALQALLVAGAGLRLLDATARREDAPWVPWRPLVLLGLAMAAVGGANNVSSPWLACSLIAAGLLGLLVGLRYDPSGNRGLLPDSAKRFHSLCGSGYAAMFAFTAAASGFIIYAPPLLQALAGLGPVGAGWVVGVYALSWTLAALVVSGSSEGVQERRSIRLGAGLILIGMLCLAVSMPTAALPVVIASAATVGVGFGCFSGLANRRVIAKLGDDDRAIGSSALLVVRQTGNVFGAATAGAIANMAGFGSGLTIAAGRSVAFWVFWAALPFAVAGVVACATFTQSPNDRRRLV